MISQFQAERRCSQMGSFCSQDSDCLHSCGPDNQVPSSRMACVGSEYDRQRSLGRCQAAWAESGDPCVFGSAPAFNTCAPSLGQPLYCQQSQLGWPNFAPGFNQSWIGQGYCMPVPSQVPSYQAPVMCSSKYIDQLNLSCQDDMEAIHKAMGTCSNTATAYCTVDGKVKIGLF
ncbi:MAG: hypothetical protein K0U52_05300 [Gammaproteobacteria bacterium]|nr:hypothetical protein [Gammaproteobacteria bacterium]